MKNDKNLLLSYFLNFQVDTNRKWNREICDQFDKMATRLGEIPDKTRELVELQRYLKASMTETMPVTNTIYLHLYIRIIILALSWYESSEVTISFLQGLMSRIGTATQRVLFLLDCTLLPAEDIQLNTRVFQWPKDMASVFDLAKTRTGHRRDQVITRF